MSLFALFSNLGETHFVISRFSDDKWLHSFFRSRWYRNSLRNNTTHNSPFRLNIITFSHIKFTWYLLDWNAQCFLHIFNRRWFNETVSWRYTDCTNYITVHTWHI